MKALRLTAALLASASLVSGPLTPTASAAGLFSSLPVSGSPSFCASWIGSPTGQTGTTGTGGGTGSGAVCAQTEPANPSWLTGSELVPADIPANSATGQGPQTEVIPAAALGNPINRLIGGDFTTNLWQRGTTPISGVSPTTYYYGPDGWLAESASNVMTVSRNPSSGVLASSAADYLGNGIGAWMRVARPSGTPSGSSCVGQVLDQKASQAFVGNNALLTFWGYAPTTFTASGYNISVTVSYNTAADSATAGTNSATFGLSISAQASGIANYTAATAGTLPGTTGTLASGVETIALSTTPTRYGVYAPIPAYTGSTQVTSVGVSFCATPTGTNTVATDYFELTGVQLEARPGTSVAGAQFISPAGVASGVLSPAPFQLITPSDEWRREYARFYLLAESGTSGLVQAGGGNYFSSATVCSIPFFLPIPMRVAPTLAAAANIGSYTAPAATTFKIIPQAAGVVLSTPFAAMAAGGSPAQATVNFTTASQTQYFQCQLSSVAGGGAIGFVAEP